MERIYEQEWRSHTAQNYTSCFRKLKVVCDTEDVKCPSLPTLIRFIKLRQQPQDVRERHGKRMAYQLSEFVDVLSADTPVHGSRPFQYVHIDHTELDIELISSRTGKPLGRPWLTLVIDAWSRRILAIYLTFASPSYVSVMMVVRDMVRRFGRLPETIVVDNGRDLISENFKSFLMALGVHLRLRPAGQPRHGAVLERKFGHLHTEFIHNLAGNTKATKNVRMTTGKHLPVNFAEWTLEAMYAGIEYWAFDFYDNHIHPVLGCSPREAFMRGLREAGSRPMRQIQFNKDFLIATCPMPERGGVRQVHPQTGVKVHDEFYWNPEFRDPRIAGQRLVVRYDPWDMTSVYVRVKDRWVHARCRRLVGLGQLTAEELKVYSAEFARKVGSAKSTAADGQRLYEFMQVFTPQGALEAAFERQSENKALYNQLQLSNINPVAPSRKICLTEEISDTSSTALDKRHEPLPPSSKPAETQAEDSLPDFDVF
jgi:putative transposase